MVEQELSGPKIKCPNCDFLSYKDFKFCTACGKRKQSYVYGRQDTETKSKNLGSLLSYIFITTALLVFFGFSESTPDDLNTEIIFSVIFYGIIIIYAIYNGKDSIPVSTKNLCWSILALIIICSAVAAVIVNFVADFLNYNLIDNYVEEGWVVEETLFISILLVGVLPAIFEEVAFRGYLYHNLEKLSNTHVAMVTSSLTFGLIHLSFLSLLWLIPLGYAFAYLRNKYQTIWYGVAGHFFYNTSVVFIEYFGI